MGKKLELYQLEVHIHQIKGHTIDCNQIVLISISFPKSKQTNLTTITLNLLF